MLLSSLNPSSAVSDGAHSWRWLWMRLKEHPYVPETDEEGNHTGACLLCPREGWEVVVEVRHVVPSDEIGHETETGEADCDCEPKKTDVVSGDGQVIGVVITHQRFEKEVL
jgi:hypothetical protein